MPSHEEARTARHRVVVIGSGFGGLFGTQALKRADVDITLVARTTHHLFQPLLYQVATGILSEGEIAPTTREVLARQQNARVILGTVTHVDLAARTVTSRVLDRETVTPYDTLLVAAGAGQSYFGNDQFAQYAPGMKSIDDALELRGRIFGAFEWAELASTPKEIERLMTFVVVGAGPTGVEMAGQIAELSHRTLKRDFRRIDTSRARIILLDAAPNVLGAFGEDLGAKATDKLKQIGVEVQLGAKVVNVDATGIEVEDANGHHRRIESVCKVWAAGVQASELGAQLAEQSGAEVDRAERVPVGDVVVALPLLLLHHVALVVEVLLVDRVEQVPVPVGLHPQRELVGALGHRLEVVGAVEPGRRVEPAPLGHEPGEVLAAGDVARALEHQVLEEVGEAGAARRLVPRAHVDPEVDGHVGHAGVRGDDDAQPVGKGLLVDGVVQRHDDTLGDRLPRRR